MKIKFLCKHEYVIKKIWKSPNYIDCTFECKKCGKVKRTTANNLRNIDGFKARGVYFDFM